MPQKRTYEKDVAAGTKTCRQCHTTKPLDQFRLEKVKDYTRYRTRCLLCERGNNVQYVHDHYEERCQYGREYRTKIRQRDRSLFNYQMKIRAVSKRWKLRLECIQAYGGKCTCCGETNPYFLQMDHVNGDGATHRRVIGRGGARIYSWLKQRGYPRKGFRILCANCNTALGWFGFCPHQGIGKQMSLL